MPSKPVVLLTLGDPSGSGPELAVKTALDDTVMHHCHPVLMEYPELVKDACDRIGRSVSMRIIDLNTLGRCPDGLLQNELVVLPHKRLFDASFKKGVPSAACGRHAVEIARTATRIALRGHVNAICTAPTSKVSLHEAGFSYNGLTDVFVQETGVKNALSMMVLDELRLVLATSHVALKDVAGTLSPQRICQLAVELSGALTEYFGIHQPRIGVAGFNPHGGEGGLYGREEMDIILPGVEAAVAQGIDAVGPISADFMISRMQERQVDGAVMMYHDQAHLPLKALGLYKPATLLLGLPIIRTSVAHGTVNGKAISGDADPVGMVNACHLAADIVVRRWESRGKEQTEPR